MAVMIEKGEQKLKDVARRAAMGVRAGTVNGLPLLLALLMTAVAAAPGVAQEKHGWLGISLQCSNCSRQQMDDVVLWSFSSPPEIQAVRERGPAAAAGMREGDLIIAVGGIDITTEEGGRAFGALTAGVPAQIRVRRGSRELDLTVTPGTGLEAFGEEWKTYTWSGAAWDSLRQQLKQLYEGQLNLQVALRNAERALRVTEAQTPQQLTEAQRQLAQRQRLQIDSIRQRLKESQKLIRLQADSLAVWTLVAPRLQVEAVPAPEARTIIVYPDAVAGARFEELTEESPLVSYFPGVDAGLLIVQVVEDTPAHVAGLREGDVVLAVNGEAVRTVADLRRRLGAQRAAELTYVRKGQKATCKIQRP